MAFKDIFAAILDQFAPKSHPWFFEKRYSDDLNSLEAWHHDMGFGSSIPFSKNRNFINLVLQFWSLLKHPSCKIKLSYKVKYTEKENKNSLISNYRQHETWAMFFFLSFFLQQALILEMIWYLPLRDIRTNRKMISDFITQLRRMLIRHINHIIAHSCIHSYITQSCSLLHRCRVCGCRYPAVFMRV